MRDVASAGGVCWSAEAPLGHSHELLLLVDSNEKLSNKQGAEVFVRQAVPDLLTTIRDGRHYNSQKVRLGRCGLARPFYLVEGPLEKWAHTAELKRMQAELANIAMVDSVLLHRTASTEESLRFLALAAARLETQLREKSAKQLRDEGALRTYGEFYAATSPPMPLSTVFGRMLLNLHGLTASMVERLIQRYQAPAELMAALEAHHGSCEAKESGWLFADVLEPGKVRRALSERLTAFLWERGPEYSS